MLREGTEVLLPDLGEVESVVVVAWLKNVGDEVREGDDLVEVETEKTTFVVPAPATGRVAEVAVGQGDKVRVGERLGTIVAV